MDFDRSWQHSLSPGKDRTIVSRIRSNHTEIGDSRSDPVDTCTKSCPGGSPRSPTQTWMLARQSLLASYHRQCIVTVMPSVPAKLNFQAPVPESREMLARTRR
eukprot:scaffold4037_cov400-Prasinococcus_capsulatus_cf.AAC.4